MPWRDDPNTPPYWIEVADLILAAHPEWAPYIVGPLSKHDLYGPDEVRFFVEIPSVHPTIREPLTIEVADRDPFGPIDTYWGGYFEHNFNFRGRLPTHEHVAQVVQRVEEWISDDFVFSQCLDRKTGRWANSYRRAPDGTLVPNEDARTLYWSWRGTHDRVEEEADGRSGDGT